MLTVAAFTGTTDVVLLFQVHQMEMEGVVRGIQADMTKLSKSHSHTSNTVSKLLDKSRKLSVTMKEVNNGATPCWSYHTSHLSVSTFMCAEKRSYNHRLIRPFSQITVEEISQVMGPPLQ